MKPKRTCALGILATLAMAAACSVDELDYEGKACPCPKDYRCDETKHCTRHGSGKGGASGDGSGGTNAAGNAGGNGVGNGGTGKGGAGVGGAGKGGSATGGSATGGSATGGSAATGPSSCVPEDECGTLPNNGLNLVAVDYAGEAYIDCSKNCLDIFTTMALHTYGDGEISLDASAGNLCLSGFVGAYSTAEMDISLPSYDTAAHGISGFEFSIEGDDVPAEVQFGYYFTSDSAQYRCEYLAQPSGHYSVPLVSVHRQCTTGVEFGTTTLTQLLNVAVFVVTTDSEETFDFCLTGLAATR